jgi:3-dehydroquinate dehydratase/shikimate dehydrogenase
MVEAVASLGADLPALFPSDRICAVVAAPSVAEMRRQFLDAIGPGQRARSVELRLDYLRSDAERQALLRWIAGRRTLPVLIATCRTCKGGGQFAGSRQAELDILGQAARAGCLWCDVEIETAAHFEPAVLRKAVAPAKLLISAHDFRGMPADVERLVGNLRGCGADAVKVAATCVTLRDVNRLLQPVRKRRDLVAIPMGEDAESARVLALREGSALAYASMARAIAPGQLTLAAMRGTYRLGRKFGRAPGLTRSTRVYAVIGDPIGHSLSPLMHNAAFAARRADAVYLPFRVRRLDDFIKAVPAFGIAGFSVTLPHKETILKYLNDCDPLAREIGAVNTVRVQRGGRLYGYNTDYTGVLQSIERHVPLGGSRVLLVGAGGSARAAAFALAKRGASVAIWARRPGKALELARAVGGEALDRPRLRKETFDAIVNCTPVGMYPGGGSPLESAELNARVVMDLIYRPLKTELLKKAERRGIAVISGVEMFLAQGAAQQEIWTGRSAPLAVMRRAVLSALAAEEKRVAVRR